LIVIPERTHGLVHITVVVGAASVMYVGIFSFIILN